MKQVLQELGSGRTILAEVPEPAMSTGMVRILTGRSLISAGTERMLVEFGRAGWLERARKNPERVRQVLDKVRTDGAVATLEAVRSKLDQAIPLGYCNVGVVDKDAAGFNRGERVVSNGAHAEVVVVPANLCARVPDNVSDDDAAFTVMASIALQGLRLAGPTLGESVVVTGLGLIGLLAVQLLRANGCRVLGIDPDARRTALARQFGASTAELGRGDDPVAAALAFSHGQGVDAVLITASTESSEPVSQAARMSRKRGRIVLVGVAGLQLNRADFYEKELTFQVSCSYGPGRYDPDYEEAGHDYPFGYVRWTEQRNFAAVLELMAAGQLSLRPLIEHRFALDEAERAYELLAVGSPLGILLEYAPREVGTASAHTISIVRGERTAKPEEPAFAFVGAGNYAARVLIPAFVRAGARLVGIASRGGVSAAHVGRKFGFATVTTDVTGLIGDPGVNAVVVVTRHDTHAQLAAQALAAGKHVFVEKPLALTMEQIDQVEAELHDPADAGRPLLMVGFNRRFAPLAVRMKALMQGTTGPKSVVVTVNAGYIPADHWTQDAAIGGGRIIGEACHFIDLVRFLVGAPIQRWDIARVRSTDLAARTDDRATITLHCADGSVGVVHYLADGHASFPKERVEVFSAGRVLQLDNFRILRGWGWPGFSSTRLWRQDKGHGACAAAFLAAIRHGQSSPIPLAEILEVSRVTVALATAGPRLEH
jgi:predicted dehydrogenase/threonine dehydrogenase-like Zn-dependent dehydrogenase